MTLRDGSTGAPDDGRPGGEPPPHGVPPHDVSRQDVSRQDVSRQDVSRQDVSPHDRARLYDLLDGRLAPDVADDVRRRLHDDPAYAALHADLLALHEALAAIPVPVSSRVEASSPEAFLAAVRRAAGLPAATRGHAGPDGSASAPSDAEGAHGVEAAGSVGALRVLPTLRRLALPLAACLGLAVGAGLYFAGGVDRLAGSADVESARATDARPGASAREGGAARSDAPADAAPPAERRAAEDPGDPGVGAPAGPFRAPGGAVPAGLRPPSDVTLDAASQSGAAPESAAEAAKEADAERQDRDDVRPTESSLPRDAEARARTLRQRLRRESGAYGEARGESAERARTKDASGADRAASDDDGARATGRGSPDEPRDKVAAKRGAADRDGADLGELVLRAASLDEARATVALFLAQARGALEPGRTALPGAQGAAPPPAAAPPTVPPAPSGPRKPSGPLAPADGSTGVPPPAPLGHLLVDVPAGVDLAALPGAVRAPDAPASAARGDGVRRIRVVVVPR